MSKRGRHSTVHGVACALALSATSLSASAQQLPAFDLRAPSGTKAAPGGGPTGGNNAGADTHLFRPAVDSKGFITVNGSDVLGAGDVSFGLVLDYGRNILRTSNHGVPQTTFDRINPLTGDPVKDANGLTIQDPGDCTTENCKFTDGTKGGTGVKALVQDSFQGTFQFNYGIANKAVIGVNVPVILMA
ncbi:MAG TPA: hypothetical protein VF395_08670, partial [Polyangiaceae bacterium]